LGLAVWAASLVVIPASLAARVTLLAPLVIVPHLLERLPGRLPLQGLGPWAFTAALALPIAFLLPPGLPAAMLTVPYLGLGLLVLAAAVTHGLQSVPEILRLSQVPALGADVAIAFLGAAAAFLTFDRLGYRPMDFDAATILLTATHFHFAGFGLLAITALLASGSPHLRAPTLGLVAGIPLTALGFVTASSTIGAVGALAVGVSGIVVALELLRIPVRDRSRMPLRAAGLALLVGMPLGIGWAMAALLGLPFIDLDTMVRTHGALNAFAVLAATFGLGRR
jgi:hypothetical protein